LLISKQLALSESDIPAQHRMTSKT